MRRFGGLLLLFLSVVMLCRGSRVEAQRTIRVPADVSSVQAGIDLAQTNDIVLVSPGVYAENLDFHGKAITVTSGATSYTEAAGTVLNGRASGSVVRFSSGETRSSILNGFTLSRGFIARSTDVGGGVYISGASPTLTNNAVVDNEGCGVCISDGAGPLLHGNQIARQIDCGQTAAQSPCKNGPNSIGQFGTGLILSSIGEAILDSNVIENNSAGVVVRAGQSLTFSNNVLRNNIPPEGTVHSSQPNGFTEALVDPVRQLRFIQNLVYGNRQGSGASYAPQVLFSGGDTAPYATVIEINNTILDGEELVLTFGSSIIANNALVKTGVPVQGSDLSAGLACPGTSADFASVDIRNNLVFNDGALQDGGCALSGKGNVIAPPQFIDAASANFHEQPTSPLVSGGDITAPLLPGTDLDLRARTVCGTIDIGAYQLRPHPPTLLTVAPNPVAGGSPVNFTASPTGNCNVPSGIVTFVDSATVIGSGTLNGSAVATLSTSFLTVGQHSITATYPGDFNFEDSVSNAVNLTVTGLPSATSLAVTPNPAKAFQPITLTANVTDPYVQVTGTVTFTAGTTVLGTAPLTNGIAAITTSKLGAGNYGVTATFDATTQFATSSASVQLQVQGAATTMTLSSSMNPSLYGQDVTFRAGVALSGSNVAPQGTVTFRDGAVVLGTGVLDASGGASLTINSLTIGTHSVTAEYGGSVNADRSVSAALLQVVNPVTVQLTLTASPNAARMGETIALQVKATANNGLPPTGTVNFFEGATALGSAPLTSGTAVFSIASLTLGKHTITATYANAASGTGLTVASVTVEVLSFDFVLTSSGTKLDIPHSGYAEVELTLSPLGAYDRPVHLACGNLPENAQCSFEREWTEPLSKGPQHVKLLVNANVILQYGPSGSVSMLKRWHPAAGILTACLACFGIRRRRLASALLLCVCALSMGLGGCSGKLPASTPAGTYPLTVVAQDLSGQAHSIHLELHVG